ncbi:MAG: hypothetical protein Q9227_004356 [Pyrenula ochraceoflavens]
MSESTLASAVVLPEPQDLPTSPDSRKRRQSSIESEERKRARIDQGSPPRPAPDERRRSSALGGKGTGTAEERKRGQRLFGALLGTLSQSSSSPAQKRRADIERKQQDKLKEKEQEFDDERRQRREKILEKRKKEQVLWDRESTRIRHQNMLSTAHFLKTQSEPSLYYKPWDLLPEQEKQIGDQMIEVQAIINKEAPPKAEINAANHQETEDVVRPSGDESPLQNNEAIAEPTSKSDNVNNTDFGQPDKDHVAKAEEHSSNPNGEPNPDTNPSDIQGDERRTKAETRGDNEAKGQDDHGGEELLEGAEDSVIY